jgi:hypothetical protein
MQKLRANKIAVIALSFRSERSSSRALSKHLKINYSTAETEHTVGPNNEDYNIVFIKASLRNKNRGYFKSMKINDLGKVNL